MMHPLYEKWHSRGIVNNNEFTVNIVSKILYAVNLQQVIILIIRNLVILQFYSEFTVEIYKISKFIHCAVNLS